MGFQVYGFVDDFGVEMCLDGVRNFQLIVQYVVIYVDGVYYYVSVLVKFEDVMSVKVFVVCVVFDCEGYVVFLYWEDDFGLIQECQDWV